MILPYLLFWLIHSIAMTALFFITLAPPVAVQGSSNFLPLATHLHAYTHFMMATLTLTGARAEASSHAGFLLKVGLFTKQFQQNGKLSATGYSYGEQVKSQPSEISL